MPSISIRMAESVQGEVAHTLDLSPPITDRLAESLCKNTVDPFMMVVKHSEDTTRIRVEYDRAKPHDIETIARDLGKKAFLSNEVDIYMEHRGRT